MARVYLSKLPASHKVYTLDMPAFGGGLNLRDAETKLKGGESPRMINLWRENGVLQARPGQEYVTAAPSSYGTTGYAATDSPFWNHIFLHIGTALYTLTPPSPPSQGGANGDTSQEGTNGDTSQGATPPYPPLQGGAGGVPEPVFLASGIPANRGTFFRFGDFLFYKNRGGFFKITYNANTGGFSVSNVTADAFVPTILINASPDSGAGDVYQPENRLSAFKRVTYNAAAVDKTVTFNASGRQAGNGIPADSAQKPDGTRRAFAFGVTAADQLRGVSSVYLDDAFQPPALYSVSTGSGVIIFNTAPPQGSAVTITLSMGVLDYHLPVDDVDSVEEVKVDGITWTAGSDYTVDLSSGVVTFAQAPPVTDPPQNNTVEITYSKANPDALNAVMNCCYASVYGSGNQLCIVLGGDTGRTRGGKAISQPNAVFWSGNTQTGLDPSYFPIDAYNLLGDTEDSVTGFGRQYDSFLVFKARSVGKLAAEIAVVNERNVVSLSYSGVNDKIGCDLPFSIQLVENNLVFANTGLNGSPGGIYMVRSASAAYENNVDRISGKIDGSNEKPGLLYDLEVAGRGNVSSFDDGRRYYLCVNGNVWLWDYESSKSADPVWYFWNGFHPVAWFLIGQSAYHLNAAGQVTRLGRFFSDYGAAFRKLYQFPMRDFGGYDRLKNVTKLLISVRCDTPSNTTLTYRTDYETRQERVSLAVAGNDRLSERDLTERDLSVAAEPAVFVRKPGCKHIRHFSLTLENNTAGEDLSILSAQIQYRLMGKDR